MRSGLMQFTQSRTLLPGRSWQSLRTRFTARQSANDGGFTSYRKAIRMTLDSYRHAMRAGSVSMRNGITISIMRCTRFLRAKGTATTRILELPLNSRELSHMGSYLRDSIRAIEGGGREALRNDCLQKVSLFLHKTTTRLVTVARETGWRLVSRSKP